jgi:hypothetical protein
MVSYQAVIWDGSGNLVAEKMVSIKISITLRFSDRNHSLKIYSNRLFVKIKVTAKMFYVKSLEGTTYKCSISFYETF